MWNIKDIKKNARQNIKKNLWTLLFIGFLMSFIFNEYVISRQANENSDIINNFITEYEENGKIELSTEAEDGTKKLNENIDRALSKMFLDFISSIFFSKLFILIIEFLKSKESLLSNLFLNEYSFPS